MAVRGVHVDELPREAICSYGLCRTTIYRWVLVAKSLFEFGFWTRQIVQALLDEKFGSIIGQTAVGRVFADSEITPRNCFGMHMNGTISQ